VPSPGTLGPVAIAGAGALGTALAHALVGAGVPVVAVASRHAARAEALARGLSGVRAVSLAEAGAAAPIVLVAVADSAIEDACQALQASPGTLLAHTSGSRSVAALDAAQARGARVGGFHPLAAVVSAPPGRALSPEEWASSFRGAAFAIEGNDDVQALLAPLARALGGWPFAIAGSDKPLYHLGASMLAAFSAGLAQLAWDRMRAAGAPDEVASAGVGHLLATVAGNVARASSPAAALTGPVARGDAGGVLRQAAAARQLSAEAQVLYAAHAEHNIQLAENARRISTAMAQELRDALLRAASLAREPLR
jgi:predicted short-subunit dehydrogenase-like oxidoreductase (DUF2520 family)